MGQSVALRESNPKADPAAVVLAGHARFTVLTSQLIRLEWSASDFRDASTVVVNNRALPVPKYQVTKKDQWVEISTDALHVRYDATSSVSFSDANLRVQVKSVSSSNRTVTWTPSLTDKDDKRLFGSLRTLDMTNGTVDLNCNAGGPDTIADSHCTYGLVSRSGYVVVDDSLSTELDNDPWPWVVETSVKPATSCTAIPPLERRVCGYNVVSQDQCDANGCCFDDSASLPNGFSCYYGAQAYQDLYFFGHGLEFKQALHDFTLVAGKIPLPPKFAFGVFYSRWWAYNDVDIDGISHEYATRSIPLDVVVLDMDWHLTFYKNNSADQSGQPKGWTGYTWNKELFPDPKAFLAHLHSNGLHVTLNLHPASGVQPWEDSYEAMATAMGIDPATKAYVPFDLTNKTFASNWLQLSLQPRQDEGVDFWWLDWQQGEDWFVAHNQASPNLNPTLWLNHVFFTNPFQWRNDTRPVLLHRFGGLGNHRYPLGFSGDVVPSWQSLQFQPYFTANAANVGFAYWSHDIGGFQQGHDAQLYTRWIQWGVFSPVLRTHSQKDTVSDRRIWTYPNANYEIMRHFINLRRRLVPYIYTQSRLTHDTGLAMLHGLYYEWPEFDEAYSYTHQYAFGSSFVVAPVVQPVDPTTQLAAKSVWVPPGVWFDLTRGSLVTGPIVYKRWYALDEVPWFAKAGSIVPFGPEATASSLGQAQTAPEALVLTIIPGTPHGSGAVYDDAGNSSAYLRGDQHSWTHFTFDSLDNASMVVTIYPANGTFAGRRSRQRYLLELRHAVPARHVQVDGRDVAYSAFGNDETKPEGGGWTYDPSHLTLLVHLDVAVTSTTRVRVQFDTPASLSTKVDLNGVVGTMARLQHVKTLLDLQFAYAEDYPYLRHAYGMSRRIQYNLTSFFQEVALWPQWIKLGVAEVRKLKLAPSVQAQIVHLLVDDTAVPHESRVDKVFSDDQAADVLVFN
ncbi:hypothetical protein DYB34_001886 [Aphanomyces astaci]|uniref:P-type domain-containing protein n=2 Tax=Aphanomyces astaci TaxID=112090 RepID=A0A418C028_APHAT|nr:hypothetical protein DYB34_001886 [Aphanomyces astaci]